VAVWVLNITPGVSCSRMVVDTDALVIESNYWSRIQAAFPAAFLCLEPAAAGDTSASTELWFLLGSLCSRDARLFTGRVEGLDHDRPKF
jgi:hypothetical protein